MFTGCPVSTDSTELNVERFQWSCVEEVVVHHLRRQVIEEGSHENLTFNVWSSNESRDTLNPKNWELVYSKWIRKNSRPIWMNLNKLELRNFMKSSMKLYETLRNFESRTSCSKTFKRQKETETYKSRCTRSALNWLMITQSRLPVEFIWPEPGGETACSERRRRLWL